MTAFSLVDQALLHAGALDNASGDFQGRTENLERLAKDFPDSPALPKAALGRGYALYKLGRYRDAEDLLAPLVEQPAMSSDAQYWLGRSQVKQNEWTKSADTFDRMLREFPDSPQAAEAGLIPRAISRAIEPIRCRVAVYQAVVEPTQRALRRPKPCGCRGCAIGWVTRRQAVESYGKLVNEHPDFSRIDAAIYRWAWLVRESDPARPGVFARLKHEFPQSRFSADAALRLAEREVADQNYDEAERLLADIARPDAREAVIQHTWYLQGRLAMARGRWTAVEAAACEIDRAVSR